MRASAARLPRHRSEKSVIYSFLQPLCGQVIDLVPRAKDKEDPIPKTNKTVAMTRKTRKQNK